MSGIGVMLTKAWARWLVSHEDGAVKSTSLEVCVVSNRTPHGLQSGCLQADVEATSPRSSASADGDRTGSGRHGGCAR